MKQSLLKMMILAMTLSLFVTCASAAEPQGTETQDDGQVIRETYCADWAADALPDSDELFAAYVEQQFYGDASVSLYSSDYCGNKLSGLNKKIYDELKAQISLVAAGQKDSTIFEVTVTADDPEEDPLLSKIYQALLADCPYELFWHDKTQGTWYEVSSSSSGSTYTITIKANFSVSSDYGSDYTITKDLSVVPTAVQNAQDIVKKYASVPDYEKLLGYRNELCALTDYNEEAADPAYTGGYGDPWQMIYMFDGNPDTKVVCEGYAKAFQYLCDETTFINNGIQSYLVSGTCTPSPAPTPASVDICGMWYIWTMGKTILWM